MLHARFEYVYQTFIIERCGGVFLPDEIETPLPVPVHSPDWHNTTTGAWGLGCLQWVYGCYLCFLSAAST